MSIRCNALALVTARTCLSRGQSLLKILNKSFTKVEIKKRIFCSTPCRKRKQRISVFLYCSEMEMLWGSTTGDGVGVGLLDRFIGESVEAWAARNTARSTQQPGWIADARWGSMQLRYRLSSSFVDEFFKIMQRAREGDEERERAVMNLESGVLVMVACMRQLDVLSNSFDRTLL